MSLEIPPNNGLSSSSKPASDHEHKKPATTEESWKKIKERFDEALKDLRKPGNPPTQTSKPFSSLY